MIINHFTTEKYSKYSYVGRSSSENNTLVGKNSPTNLVPTVGVRAGAGYDSSGVVT